MKSKTTEWLIFVLLHLCAAGFSVAQVVFYIKQSQYVIAFFHGVFFVWFCLLLVQTVRNFKEYANSPDSEQR